LPQSRIPGRIADMSAKRIPYSSGTAAGEWSPNGLCIRNPQGRYVPAQARAIKRSIGTFKAARYLRSRGWSLEAALHYLAKP
jgi:hypothetical protein